LRKAIQDEFGIVFKFKPMMEANAAPAPVTAPVPVVAAAPVLVESITPEPEPEDETEEPEEEPAAQSRNAKVDEDARYGESLLREILGAEPLDD
jgi:DNA polymerase-3 subunit gamma/tau